ncbi:MAG: arginine--tRNA ligase [Propionibacteriaceae bacterium]|jgi:arginyl-tRNA synthetase|nr:arginine--tRNA ligase [Propionibacteriaceae bacterium]
MDGVPSLSAEITARMVAVTGADPELRPATKTQFGHYQSNIALRLAKKTGRPPREVAAEIVNALNAAGFDDLAEPIEVAGPGFLNIRLRATVLARAVSAVIADPQIGLSIRDMPQTVVVDYSGPNVAKQMHVGHLRSTIIGDCLARVLEAVGNNVIRRNHIGDWGRQFGMLIEQILDEGLDLDTLDLSGAEELYQRANAHLNADAEFAERARSRVVALQSKDSCTIAIWERLIEVSLTGFDASYARMNVLLTRDDVAGESSYNSLLAPVCADLETRGIAVQDQGALVVFVPGFEAPAILRNSAGGYGYDITDVAAIRQRVEELHADRLIYLTDARQADHFHKVFAVAQLAGYLPERVSAEFVGFGMVLGLDGKPFRTRDGNTVHLSELLDEAEQLAAPEVALAAIKYADLSNGLQKDYVFDPERMVTTTGDTGPYLQYAHARVCQILKRAAAEDMAIGTNVTVLSEVAEIELALALTRFSDVVDEVALALTPHKLCTYLFELASKLSNFYEQCPVLKSVDALRSSRLALCDATRRVLARGLNLLGIAAVERM